jgi:hypothetical protein
LLLRWAIFSEDRQLCNIDRLDILSNRAISEFLPVDGFLSEVDQDVAAVGAQLAARLLVQPVAAGDSCIVVGGTGRCLSSAGG